MPARINLINRIIPAIHIRQLPKVRVPGQEASGCRVVKPRSHLQDPRVPVVAVSGSGSELIWRVDGAGDFGRSSIIV